MGLSRCILYETMPLIFIALHDSLISSKSQSQHSIRKIQYFILRRGLINVYGQ